MTSYTDAATIEDELAGQLYDLTLIQRIDNCERCRVKNHKRTCAADAEPIDGLADWRDGDDVTVHAVRRETLDGDDHWMAAAAHHRHHPQVPFEDVVVAGSDQARAHARVRVTNVDSRLIDVDAIAISPASEGPEMSAIDERYQTDMADGPDVPDDMDVVDRSASDPPATWPEAEREWLRQLEADHGPLELPVTKIGTVEIPIDDDEPGI